VEVFPVAAGMVQLFLMGDKTTVAAVGSKTDKTGLSLEQLMAMIVTGNTTAFFPLLFFSVTLPLFSY